MAHVLYTGGTFDLLHSGHINFLKQCKSLVGSTGKVVVSLNTDDFILEYKNTVPVLNFDERKELLLACKYVDDVVANIGGQDSKQAIMLVKPTIVAIGSDWAEKDYYSQMQFSQAWLNEMNIMLVYIPYTKGISTSNIKQRIIRKT